MARKRQYRRCGSVDTTLNRIRSNSNENVPASWRVCVHWSGDDEQEPAEPVQDLSGLAAPVDRIS